MVVAQMGRSAEGQSAVVRIGAILDWFKQVSGLRAADAPSRAEYLTDFRPS
jgi:hypothetical protein